MCGTIIERNNMVRSASPSPLPKIEKSVFSSAKCRPLAKRRPSLEDDILEKFAEQNKENLLAESPTQNLHRNSSSNSNVFRFSSSAQFDECENAKAPRINIVGCEDEVFVEPLPNLRCPSSSSRLQLTPSTSGGTPAIYLSSPLPIGSYSPHLNQGLCCSTPNRLLLQQRGLDTIVDKLVLGKGAYGTVVLGQLKGKKVAVKVVEKEQEGSKVTRRRKSLESELLASQLSHRHVVKVYGVYEEDDKRAVIMMEYVGSRNLQKLVIEDKEKHLGKSWLLAAASQISSGLAHCHSKSIVHLDLKPANVLVTSSGLCKIGDFGCAKSLVDSSQEELMSCDLVGTPGYQAPELLKGCKAALACDVYSLGILLWQLDARSLPFPNEHPQAVMFRIVALGARPSEPLTHHVGMSTFSALYKSCWSGDSCRRPSSNQVFLKLEGMRHAVKKVPSVKKSSLKMMR